MGRSAAGGGSFRSSGGGGGFHSSGGHSHSYSSGRGSFSGSSHSSSWHSSSSSSHSSYSGFSSFRPHYSMPMYSYGGGGYFRRRTGGFGCCCSSSFFGVAIFFIIICIVAAVISGLEERAFGSFGRGEGSIQANTIVREKLDRSNVNETGYLEDQAGWITSKYDATVGMRKFFERTGVQPFLIISESIDGNSNPSIDRLDEYLARRYDELFTDEQHILLIFFDNGSNWYTRYNCGSKAKLLMDNEACEILLDYFDYYADSDLSDDAYFSTVFDKASERIMSKPHSVSEVQMAVIIGLIVIAVIVVLIIMLRALKRSRDAKIMLEQEKQKILNM